MRGNLVQVVIISSEDGSLKRLERDRQASGKVSPDARQIRAVIGEITKLILKDATGDMHSYGIMTDVVDSSPGRRQRHRELHHGSGGRDRIPARNERQSNGVKKGPVVVMGNVCAPR